MFKYIFRKKSKTKIQEKHFKIAKIFITKETTAKTDLFGVSTLHLLSLAWHVFGPGSHVG